MRLNVETKVSIFNFYLLLLPVFFKLRLFDISKITIELTLYLLNIYCYSDGFRIISQDK